MEKEQQHREPEQLQTVKEGYNRLCGCVNAEHCEYMNCIYFENPEQLREVIDFLGKAIKKAEAEAAATGSSTGDRPGQRP